MATMSKTAARRVDKINERGAKGTARMVKKVDRISGRATKKVGKAKPKRAVRVAKRAVKKMDRVVKRAVKKAGKKSVRRAKIVKSGKTGAGRAIAKGVATGKKVSQAVKKVANSRLGKAAVGAFNTVKQLRSGNVKGAVSTVRSTIKKIKSTPKRVKTKK